MVQICAVDEVQAGVSRRTQLKILLGRESECAVHRAGAAPGELSSEQGVCDQPPEVLSTLSVQQTDGCWLRLTKLTAKEGIVKRK